MTKPLSASLQEAQRLTEDAKKEQSYCLPTLTQLYLNTLAQKIILLIEESELNPTATPSALAGRCIVLPEPATHYFGAEQYAQNCVLACPDLFPYFAQLYPRLGRTIEAVINRHFIYNNNFTQMLIQFEFLYKSICATDGFITAIVDKIEREFEFDNTKHTYYTCLAQTFNSEGHLTDYVINHPNTNALLARKTAESELERVPLEPSKVFALLSAYARALEWECLPSTLESKILEMCPARQKDSLLWMTRFLQDCEDNKVLPQEFACLMEAPFIHAVLGQPDLKDDRILSSALIEFAITGVNNGYAMEALESFKGDIHDPSILVLPFLSLIHSQGISKEACDAFFKRICTSRLESKHLSICFKALSRISALVFTLRDLSRENKEYLVQRISEEPSLIPWMRLITMLGDNLMISFLSKEKLENKTFTSVLEAIFQKNDGPLLEAAKCKAQIGQAEKDPTMAQMTAEILKSGGFKKDQPRDLNYVLSGEQTIAEVQGSTAFCEKTLQYAIKIPSVLSHSSLREAQDADINTALTLRYKRLGHAFSLRGMVKLPNGTQTNLTGFNETFVIPMLRATFDEFSSDLISPGLREFVKTSLAKASWHENPSDGEIVGSGWIWHSMQEIFHNGYLYHCNRGNDCGNKSGISILKIGNTEKLTPEYLRQIASRLSVKRSDYISLEKIKTELGAVEVDYIPMKGQKVGNCVYANAKALIYTLLLIGISEENAEKDLPTTPHFSISTRVQATEIYKQFFRFDKATDLQDFLIDLEKAATGEFSTEEGKNYLEGVGKIAELLRKWIFNHTVKTPKVGSGLLAKTLELICLRDWD